MFFGLLVRIRHIFGKKCVRISRHQRNTTGYTSVVYALISYFSKE